MYSSDLAVNFPTSTFVFMHHVDACIWLKLFSWMMILSLIYSVSKFLRNLYYARRSGFPTIICPWDQQSLIWIALGPMLEPHMKTYFPKFLYHRLILTVYGWDFRHRQHPFKQIAAEQGDEENFMLVTCGGPEFWSCDAEIATQVLGRPNDFHPQDLAVRFMSKFGPNVLTAHGEDWARQRKVVARVVNDRVSNTVFEEAVYQTEGLIAELFPSDNQTPDMVETNKLFDAMKKITTHVLSGATMGASIPWNDDSGKTTRPGFQFSYIQACKIVLNALTGPIILPTWLLSHYPSFAPGADFLRQVSHAIKELPEHTKHLLDGERKRSQSAPDETARSNILSQLLDASNRTDQNALSIEEMTGNLFIFTAAGFDTTSALLSYALVLLARYPKWQEWLFQEVDSIAVDSKLDAAASNYQEVFPKAQRTLAFMFEVLRQYPPIVDIGRQTKTQQAITTSKGTYWIPANSLIYLSLPNVHIKAEIYRNHNIHQRQGEQAAEDDELIFRPSRWLDPVDGTLWQPPKGTYAPWSMGPRVCPGQKMAQVEFTAVITTLLSRFEIKAVHDGTEGRQQVDESLDRLLQNSINIFTLQMVNVYEPKGDSDGLRLRLRRRTQQDRQANKFRLP